MRLLLCQLLPAAWLMLSAGSAWALPAAPAAGEAAPMCDPEAASVIAEDEIPEVDRGRFEALPCEAQLLLSGWELNAPELGRKAASCQGAERPAAPPQADAPRLRYEGASQLGVPFPARAEPAPAALGERAGLGARRGHARLAFRPPVARARVAG